MKARIIGIMMIIHTAALFADAPVVENVQLRQRDDGSLFVDIYYGLKNDNDHWLEITIEASDNNGLTWDLPCKHLSGDVGERVKPGQYKYVNWDFFADNPNVNGGGYRVRVTANDNIGSVEDIDGNRYRTIKIGDQIWMAENLKVTHYRNGDAIPNILDRVEWNNVRTGAYCNNDNNEEIGKTYGHLYNWYAATDSRNIAPVGWHVPIDEEWQTLINFVGGMMDAGVVLKESGTEYWNPPNPDVTNESGFTALPAGGRSGDDNYYGNGMGYYASFWSTTESSDINQAWNWALKFDHNVFTHDFTWTGSGFSIRCIKGETVSTPTFSPLPGTYTTTTALNVTISCSTAGATIHYTTNGSDPTENDPTITSGGSVTISSTTTIKARAFKSGLPKSFVASGTYTIKIKTDPVTDIDGNTYQTVKIGNQIWMAENLKVTHYRNGDVLLYVTEGGYWKNLTSSAYCNYDNNADTVKTYGRLYNWYAGNDNRNIAPAGWHVPSDEDWQALADYLGGVDIAGAKLKESGTLHWNLPNLDATNESGFCALPAGARKNDDGYFGNSIRNYTSFWSTTLNGNQAWGWTLQCNTQFFNHDLNFKRYGFSIRCVKGDTGMVSTPIFSPIPGTFATAQIVAISCLTSSAKIHYTINGLNPTESDPTIANGGSIYVSSSTTLKARAYRSGWTQSAVASGRYTISTKTEIVTDVDGNTYLTIKIGNQIWMAENLKATHYRNGDAITNFIDAADWKNLQTGAYCNYDNNADTAKIYGRLYNWYVVNDSRNIAPLGWHVPSVEEWQTLTDYLGGNRVAGAKLKESGNQHWNPPAQDVTNESGFTALPAGGRKSENGSYNNSLGEYTMFWSTTESDHNNAQGPGLHYFDIFFESNLGWKWNGFSIRCIKGETVSTPTFSSLPGTYTTVQNVNISCSTSGAILHYTTNGLDPTESDPTITNGGSVTISITTTLKARAFKGGMPQSFIASGVYTINLTTAPVTDIDGNVYQTIKIGNQIWMAENLKATHYRNGVAIRNVVGGTDWQKLKTGAYCNYNNNADTAKTYGRLYNWYAIKDSRNIAPNGWHVPSDEEWQTLAEYLGGVEVVGAKMKESGTLHWTPPNTGASNESGFTALAAGARKSVDIYYDNSIGEYTTFWSSTEGVDNQSCWTLHCFDTFFNHDLGWKYFGFSIRCIKD